MDDTICMWLIPAGVLIAAVTTFTIWLSVKRTCTLKHSQLTRTHNATTMIVMGSGGHTAEMLRILNGLSENYSPRHYIMADSDPKSLEKILQLESQRNKDTNTHREFKTHAIPRSRELHQSWLSTVATTLHAFIKAVPLVYTIQPHIILCNGPGTCVPLCLAGLLLKIVRLVNVKIFYIESFCRVTSMSLSGQLCYYLVDDIFVQWPQLQAKYSRAKYVGRLV